MILFCSFSIFKSPSHKYYAVETKFTVSLVGILNAATALKLFIGVSKRFTHILPIWLVLSAQLTRP